MKTKRLHERDKRGYCISHIQCELGSPAEPGHMKEVLDAGVDANIQLTSNESTR